MDVFRVFDALNDPRNLERAMTAVKKVGGHAQGTICYTVSPLHDVDGYIKLAGQLLDMGADSIALKDMAALLKPQPAYDIIRGVKDTYGDDVQINVHCHSTTGVTLVTLMKAIEARRCGRYRHLFAVAWPRSQPHGIPRGNAGRHRLHRRPGHGSPD